MRCSRHGNGGRMHVRPNGKPLEEVAVKGGCERNVVHRMNEGYRAWGVL